MPPRLEDFRPLQLLGEGAAGRVHLATPRRSMPYASPGDPVALKCYKRTILEHPGQAIRIRREFGVGSQLVHPNLVRMFDYALEPVSGDPFLVMEYVDGVALSSWISMFHPVPGIVLYKIFLAITDAVALLHVEGVHHRDVKPANIMVTNTLDAKLMDLGVVRITSEALERLRDDKSVTPENVTLGTIRNSAPEMLFGEEYDERADVYSLGTVLYALLHGEEVFSEEPQWARLTQLVRTEPPQFDDGLCGRDQITAALKPLASQLLHKDPGLRPTNAVELKHLLEQTVEPLATVAASQPVLHGYVATALTGLPDDSAEAMAFMSTSIAEVAKTYGIYVYQPRRFTDPLLHPDVDPVTVYLTDRRRVESTDILFVVANKPSFGVGQEVEIAASYGKPTVLIARNGTRISRMVTGSFAHIIDTILYDSPEELERKLRRCLRETVASIRNWAVASRNLPQYDLGDIVASRRMELGYESAESFAEAARLSSRLMGAIEGGEYENVGLRLLGRVADALDLEIRDVVGRVSRDAPRSIRQDDPSFRNLETLARRVGMSAAAYFALRDEHRREVAASGSAAIIPVREWASRFEAFERHRLAEAGMDEQAGTSQQRLL